MLIKIYYDGYKGQSKQGFLDELDIFQHFRFGLFVFFEVQSAGFNELVINLLDGHLLAEVKSHIEMETCGEGLLPQPHVVHKLVFFERLQEVLTLVAHAGVAYHS